MLQFNNIKKSNKKNSCFILGNSPCLAEVDLTVLNNETVFVTNQGFKAVDLGLAQYDYYVISDPREIDKAKDDINKNVKCLKFISSLIYKKNQFDCLNKPFLYFTRNKGIYSKFPSKFEDGWGKVYSVIFDAAIIASLIGYKRIYFIGVSFDYSRQSQHFYNEDKINNTNLLTDNMENLSKVCSRLNKHFESNGVQMFNCTEKWKFTELIKPLTLRKAIDDSYYC